MVYSNIKNEFGHKMLSKNIISAALPSKELISAIIDEKKNKYYAFGIYYYNALCGEYRIVAYKDLDELLRDEMHFLGGLFDFILVPENIDDFPKKDVNEFAVPENAINTIFTHKWFYENIVRK